MNKFIGINPTLEDYWRGIVLFGRNVACYKFALAKSLLELAPQEKSLITLEELAEPFSRHVTEHLKIADKQTTSRSSRFLDACRHFNAGEMTKEHLLDTTVRLGFENVIDAFHHVGGGEVPTCFFTDERRGTSRGIVITDELFQLLESYQGQSLRQEVEARWRLVERAWELNISRHLIAVDYDPDRQLLFTGGARSRADLTSVRDALNGYQKGKCFYSGVKISIEAGSESLADVDHFFPRLLGYYGIAQPIDGVWNLVLASAECNRGVGGKFDQLPHARYLEQLHTRNEFLINSHHPLRETLIRQTGRTERERQRFLQKNYTEARTKGGRLTGWQPPFEYPVPFLNAQYKPIVK